MFFRRITLISCILFAAVLLLWIFEFYQVRESDRAAYRQFKLTQQKIPANPSQALAASTHQIRQGIRKDIWFSQEGNSRLHYRIESRSSVLTLLPKENKIDFIENLEGIKCWMQDKLYYQPSTAHPMQQMRFIEADHGTYQYMSQHFIAQSVALALYRLPGHYLPQVSDPSYAYLKGVARDVSFSVSGKTPQFEAKHFKASLKEAR